MTFTNYFTAKEISNKLSLPLNQMNMQHYMILLRMSPYFTSKSSKYQCNKAQVTSHHVNCDFKGSISFILLTGTVHVMVMVNSLKEL
jgi:membrane-bound inhibitor of C-type lysozyme